MATRPAHATTRGIIGYTRATRPVETMSRTVVVSDDVLRALQPAADQRGVSVNKLCRDLLAAIADDNLVGALLDA